MARCFQEEQIDDYLLGRLGETESGRFEEHYFNCSSCFARLAEREELIGVIRSKGRDIFKAPLRPEKARRRFALLRPWPAAAVLVAAGALAVVLLLPRAPETPLKFPPPADDTLRGGSIAIIAPQGELASTPAALEWEAGAAGLDYQVTLTGPGLVEWTKDATETRVPLPEEIKRALKPGAEYSWKVKAFRKTGAFTGSSKETRFRIAR